MRIVPVAQYITLMRKRMQIDRPIFDESKSNEETLNIRTCQGPISTLM